MDFSVTGSDTTNARIMLTATVAQGKSMVNISGLVFNSIGVQSVSLKSVFNGK